MSKRGLLAGQPIYVDAVSAPEAVKAGEPVVVTVVGNLPTPAWEIHHVEVKRAAHTVTVTLWCRKTDHGMGIQMLSPVTRQVPIEALGRGEWTIKVVGHNGTGGDTAVTVR